MPRPWTCPVCRTVIMLEDRRADGKIICPTCGTQFAYPDRQDQPRRRESAGGGEDRDAPTRREEK